MSFPTEVWVQGMDVEGVGRVVYVLCMEREEVGLMQANKPHM